MTKAEILALLKTEEGQAALKEITDGLEGNRNTILSEKKKLQGSLEAVNTKLTELETERDSLRQQNFSLVVDGAIEKVLDQVKVLAQHRRAVRALIRSETLNVSEKDGEKIVTIGADKKPLEVWAAEWSQTDEGKAYVSGPLVHGGSAPGSHESGSTGFRLENATPEQILENLPKLVGGKR
jgi:hypothetical protein